MPARRRSAKSTAVKETERPAKMAEPHPIEPEEKGKEKVESGRGSNDEAVLEKTFEHNNTEPPNKDLTAAEQTDAPAEEGDDTAQQSAEPLELKADDNATNSDTTDETDQVKHEEEKVEEKILSTEARPRATSPERIIHVHLDEGHRARHELVATLITRARKLFQWSVVALTVVMTACLLWEACKCSPREIMLICITCFVCVSFTLICWRPPNRQ